MARSTSTKTGADGDMTAKEKKAAREKAREQELIEKGRQQALAEMNQRAIERPDQVGDAHGAVERPGKGTTVTVALKLGVAYFDIQLCRRETISENTQTGPRDVTKFFRTGNVVRLRGTAYPRGTVPDGFPEKPMIVAGAALNMGVDRAFWEAWVEQNRKNPLVVNKMIFAAEDIGRVKDEARDLADVASGLEPINPKKDRRMPKSTNAAVGQVETEEGRASKARAEQEA